MKENVEDKQIEFWNKNPPSAVSGSHKNASFLFFAYSPYRPYNINFHTGFGDKVDADRETVDQMVTKLKEEIKYMNAFVIVFNGQVLAVQSSLSAHLFYRTAFEVHPSAEKHDPSV